MRKIEVRRMGTIERVIPPGRRRRARLHYRPTDGYAIFVNGVERQPWVPKREAEREAKRLREAV